MPCYMMQYCWPWWTELKSFEELSKEQNFFEQMTQAIQMAIFNEWISQAMLMDANFFLKGW